jgi:hypothetical protein
MMIRTRILVAGLCALLALPATAEAKAPPKGKYECTISGILFGNLIIKSASTYKRNGKTGKYTARGGKRTFADGVKGWPIKFKTGSFRGFKGRWHKGNDGTYEIALENPLDDFESIYCDK